MEKKKHDIILSICIVSFNVKEYLDICLTSIFENIKGISFEVIVVDNASKDQTLKMLRDKFPSVTVFAEAKNLGFSKANNIAMKKSRGDYVLLLNPDTKILPESVENLIEYLKIHPDCGIIGPKLLNSDGSIQNGLREFPSPTVVLARNTWLKHIPFFKNKINRYHMRHYNLQKSGYVDQVSGAAMLFSKNIVERIGYLDERFFIFFEEVDYCKRVKDIGLNVYYYADYPIYHFGGKSRDSVNITVQIFHMESQLKYLKKHNSKIFYGLFSIIYKTFFVFFLFLDLIIDCIFSPFYYLLAFFKPEIKNNRKIKNRISKFTLRRHFILKELFSFIFCM